MTFLLWLWILIIDCFWKFKIKKNALKIINKYYKNDFPSFRLITRPIIYSSQVFAGMHLSNEFWAWFFNLSVYIQPSEKHVKRIRKYYLCWSRTTWHNSVHCVVLRCMIRANLINAHAFDTVDLIYYDHYSPSPLCHVNSNQPCQKQSNLVFL